MRLSSALACRIHRVAKCCAGAHGAGTWRTCHVAGVVTASGDMRAASRRGTSDPCDVEVGIDGDARRNLARSRHWYSCSGGGRCCCRAVCSCRCCWRRSGCRSVLTRGQKVRDTCLHLGPGGVTGRDMAAGAMRRFLGVPAAAMAAMLSRCWDPAAVSDRAACAAGISYGRGHQQKHGREDADGEASGAPRCGWALSQGTGIDLPRVMFVMIAHFGRDRPSAQPSDSRETKGLSEGDPLHGPARQ